MGISGISNKALMKISKRSERAEIEDLVGTFVDVGPLFTLFSRVDHQIVYGRRGTGKTHALQYLSSQLLLQGDLPIYLDLSNIGSSGGIYNDRENYSVPERATRLLVDVLIEIHEKIVEFCINSENPIDLSVVGPILDRFASEISTVKVVGTTENKTASQHAKTESTDASVSGNVGTMAASLDFKRGFSLSQEEQHNNESIEKGQSTYVIHFGSVRKLLESIVEGTGIRRLWILLDEWSSVPIDLQPYLADLLRRSFFPIRKISAKIAAIEYRSKFSIPGTTGDYVGIELGADASTDVNLDDFMVFDNDETKARWFYKNLLFRHVLTSDEVKEGMLSFSSEDDFVNKTFTQVAAFDELVKASEGVPRDAIHIVSQAAQYAGEEKISIPNIRKAALAWYQNGKQAAVVSRESSIALLHWITDKVIGERKARAFLLESNVRYKLIEDLFDARVLHVLKKNISTHDRVGLRYDAYKLDYGCYVDLITTTRAPAGLLPTENPEEFVDVPPDDYRAIRRAILNLEEFEQSIKAAH